MKIVFTKHAENKFKFLGELGWHIKKQDIKVCLRDLSKTSEGYRGAKVAIKSISPDHDLRTIYGEESGIITVITFYPVRKSRYD